MGCGGSKSVKEKDNNQPSTNSAQVKTNQKIENKEQEQQIQNNQQVQETQNKENNQQLENKQELENKQQIQNNQESKKEPTINKELLKDENIELLKFTSNSLDFKKLQLMELAEHNYLRSLHNAPPLILNEELNEMAQKYAETIAKKNVLQHSSHRELKGKKGEWVGENLFYSSSSGQLEYPGGDMSKAWYDEIHDYNFKTGKPKKSGDVVGHFTQLVWKDSKEVGFGIAFNGNVCFGVANYYPGGNFNNLELEQVGNLIEVKSKSCKDLFQLESVLKRELDVINEYRKMHQVDSLELDRTLCNKATSHAEYMGKTGNFQVYEENGKWENWTNWTKMNLIRGALYKGGEGVKKWYKLLKDYDFNNKSAKDKSRSFYINMGVALIWKRFTKVGFGYYFKEDNLFICALFDGLVTSPQNNYVFPPIC
jgi:uncharacterized protein YkwD